MPDKLTGPQRELLEQLAKEFARMFLRRANSACETSGSLGWLFAHKP